MNFEISVRRKYMNLTKTPIAPSRGQAVCEWIDVGCNRTRFRSVFGRQFPVDFGTQLK